MGTQINGLFPGEIFPTSTLGGCIDVFENIFPNSEETILYIENECSDSTSDLNWFRSTTIAQGMNQTARTSYDINLTECAKYLNNTCAQNIHNQIYLLLLASVGPYVVKHNIFQVQHEDYNILKYNSGQEYQTHADSDGLTKRTISAVIYLNDDYEGGEIEFINFGIKLKPKAGTLLLFPSNYAYAHRAHAITSGTKYAIVTWIKEV